MDGAGGFELLRCVPNTRDLEIFPERVTKDPRLLKCQVGNGKIYIRPIQRNLALDAEEEEEGSAMVNWNLGTSAISVGMKFNVFS